MDIKERKKEIRRGIKEIKRSLGAEILIEKSLEIEKRLESMEQFAKADTILLYYSLPDEVNTEYLLERYSNRVGGSKRIILPVVEGDYLILKEYIPTEVSEGYQSILEPTGGEVISPADIDFAVIPGVAFDSSCNRMGRGKGFYDRLLPHLNCECAGLGFDFQIVEQVPCEIFDKPLNYVVTGSGIYTKG